MLSCSDTAKWRSHQTCITRVHSFYQITKRDYFLCSTQSGNKNVWSTMMTIPIRKACKFQWYRARHSGQAGVKLHLRHDLRQRRVEPSLLTAKTNSISICLTPVLKNVCKVKKELSKSTHAIGTPFPRPQQQHNFVIRRKNTPRK